MKYLEVHDVVLADANTKVTEDQIKHKLNLCGSNMSFSEFAFKSKVRENGIDQSVKLGNWIIDKRNSSL